MGISRSPGSSEGIVALQAMGRDIERAHARMIRQHEPIPTTLSDRLRQLGLLHTAAELNDLIARATQKPSMP